MRALITGGNGFVGHWLSQHLRAVGDEVVSIDREVNVVDEVAVMSAVGEAAPDAIYHLAALTHVGQSWNEPRAVLEVNVIGTANVLAAARAANPSCRVLFVSSAEVYGVVAPEELPITEAFAVAPSSPYAASKAAAEMLVQQAVRGYGQPVMIVRPFNHVGPGQGPDFAVSALARRIIEARSSGGSTVLMGSLTARRDFTDVRDVVRAYRLLIDRGEAGAVYNVCRGVDIGIGDIAEGLMRLAGVRVDIDIDPALVRPVDQPVVRGDASRLHDATGWKPEIAFEDTLADVLAYWETHS